jgi:2-methylcitrate dehydratase PrpD
MAALTNSTAAHALELDDTDSEGFVHTGAVVIPAALAVGEALGSSGREVLEAVIVGYEIASRLARWVNPAHRLHGYHTTATVTTFGAAAAAARLQRLTSAEAQSALGVAASFAGGTFSFLADGSNVKRVHAGKASLGGILATQLARNGVVGPKEAIDGDVGFFRTQVGEMGELPNICDLDTYVISEVGMKPYPCCRFCHGSIDAAIALHKRGVNAKNIASVRIAVSKMCADQTGERRPGNELQRQFSTPYGVALGLMHGAARLEHYRNEPDSHALALASDTDLIVDPELGIGERTSTVMVTLHDGSQLRERVRYPSGEPQNPISRPERRRKFEDLTSSVLSATASADLYERLQMIGQLEHVGELLAACRPATAA